MGGTPKKSDDKAEQFDNPINEEDNDDEHSEPATPRKQDDSELLDPQEAVFVKMGLKKEIIEGDVDAFILNWCTNAHNSTWLETGILICILVNTALLMIQNPATTLTDDTLYIIMIMDYVLTVSDKEQLFGANRFLTPVVECMCRSSSHVRCSHE